MRVGLTWGRAVELLSHQRQNILAYYPVCWLPWAMDTSRADHLPIGSAGLIATAVVERAAQRVGGIVYPTLWHHDTVETGVFQRVMMAWLTMVADQGCQVAVVTGLPGTVAEDLALIEAAEMALCQHRLLALAVSPLELVDGTMHDRGALWETSLMLALRPDLVDLTRVVGEYEQDVRNVASASLGQQSLMLAGERLAGAVRDLLEHRNTAALAALYQQRRERYRQ